MTVPAATLNAHETAGRARLTSRTGKRGPWSLDTATSEPPAVTPAPPKRLFKPRAAESVMFLL